MFKDADPLGLAILMFDAIGALVSVVVLALGFWLIRKRYRRMLARKQRLAGWIATGAFLMLVLLNKLIFLMVPYADIRRPANAAHKKRTLGRTICGPTANNADRRRRFRVA